jgi:hypothetical protein
MEDTEFERGVRQFLRDKAAQVNVTQEFSEQVRPTAAARRGRTKYVPSLVAVIVVAGALTIGVASRYVEPAPAQTANLPATAVRNSLSCPHTMPSAGSLPTSRDGMRSALVPGQPTAAIACTYDTVVQTGGSDQGPTTQFVGRIEVANEQLAPLVAALDRPISSYPRSCPFTRPAEELLFAFGYEDGAHVDVEVTPGCAGLTNGLLTGSPLSGAPLPSAITSLAIPNT